MAKAKKEVKEIEPEEKAEEVYFETGEAYNIKDNSSEIEFLKKILQIQHEGCWGHHLDTVIKDRINQLS